MVIRLFQLQFNILSFEIFQSIPQNPPVIRRQDLLSSIARIARSPGENQIIWKWIGDNCLKLISTCEMGTLNKIIETVSSCFVTARQRDDFKAFVYSVVDRGENFVHPLSSFQTFVFLHSDAARQQFQLSIERTDANIRWNAANLPTIIRFLRPSNE